MFIMLFMYNLFFEGYYVIVCVIEEFGCTRLLKIYCVLWNFYFEIDFRM